VAGVLAGARVGGLRWCDVTAGEADRVVGETTGIGQDLGLLGLSRRARAGGWSAGWAQVGN
jgi:hypothetical protein